MRVGHVDAPDHPVSLLFDNGRRVSDYLDFHNIAKYPERIFCFCTSMRHGPEHSKFGDACVKINNPEAFKKRLKTALAHRNQLSRLERPFLTVKPISYYETKKSAPVDITDPRQLSFKRGGYKLERMIVPKQYSIIQEKIANRPAS